ncbi:MAG: hypothetical protein K2P93_06480 [Alphaproteobacteria bacterium]|nr:hypothetical protein [Alphaproteobacteria bacterium]
MNAKLYTDGVIPPNFVSRTGEDISETHAKCLPKGLTYNKERERIIPCSYQHLLPTGRTLVFDWGHGCDHADTIEQHGGILSTNDPDNLVPQNRFYNRYIRNPLVQRIRSAGIGGEYREISFYYHTPHVTNKTKIPEAFIFIELYNGTPEAAYFFPNLIDYEALDFEKLSRSNYLNYLDLFRINELISYFYIPFVQAQNPIPHMEQCNKGTILSHSIHADITALFNNLTEHAFPPRARATLIKTIMSQSINKAAILDFEGLTSLESAIHYYSNNRIYWELDDRSEGERQATFLTSFPNLSEPVQRAYETTKDKFPEKYKEERAFREAIVRGFGSLVDMMGEADQEVMRTVIGGKSIKNIRLAQKYLKMAHYKIESGDYNNRNLRGIIHILNYTPEFEDLETARVLFNLTRAMDKG